MSEVALVLGAAVVKTACRIWFGESALAETLGGDLTDLLKSKVSGELDRRKVRRRFEQFEETVAQQVLDYLDHEFRGLADNEREAAIRAVADTLTAAPLTDATLFESDLDPLSLERHLRAGVGAWDRERGVPIRGRFDGDLGDGAHGLYDRLLPEACAYVISVAKTLPAFGPGAFTELLRRDSVIIEQLDELLRRLPAQTEAPVPARQADAAFTTAYLRRVADKWDHLRLYGTDARTRRYPLSVAYLSLSVGAAAGRPDGIRVEEALADSDRTMIRGLAGSGKTTLLQWLAVRAARRDFPDRLAAWDGLVPFFVPLREYVDDDLPGPADLVRHAGAPLAGQAPEGWAARVLAEGHGLVLVDGVDELPAIRREQVRRWLDRLTADHPDCRYVVTSRPNAADAAWLAGEGFSDAELQPLSPADIRAFIGHWHDAVRGDTADAEEHRRLDEFQRRLTATVLDDRHLRGLATTPLLCALLCALHRDRRSALPRERMEVYDAALAMLLERRDVERGIPADGLDLSRQDKELLLQDFALWMLDNGWSDAQEDRAIGQIDRTLPTLNAIDAEPEDVFRLLLIRSGLLQTPAARRVGFVHRTFEEYLGAKAIVRHDRLASLVDRADDDQWREVIAMAAGHAARTVRPHYVELIKGLLDRAETRTLRWSRLRHPNGGDGTARAKVVITTLACLRDWPHMEEPLKRRLTGLAYDAVLPPRTPEHVRALMTAGDFGIELLLDTTGLPVEFAAQAISGAATAGGPLALQLIARIAQETGTVDGTSSADRGDLLRQVRYALGAAWPAFDPEEYARCVFAESTWGSEIVVHAREILPVLGRIPHLESLTFSPVERCVRDEDVAEIARLGQLTRLRLDEVDTATDVSALSALRGLTHLTLHGWGGKGFRELAELPHLESLSILLAPLPPAAHHELYAAYPVGALSSLLTGFPELRSLTLGGDGPVDLSSLTPRFAQAVPAELRTRSSSAPVLITVTSGHSPVGAGSLDAAFTLRHGPHP